MHRLAHVTLPALLSAIVAAAPGRADACGGTFCDSGPNAMPVDQTGENILFILDGDTVEAHIQIQYDPETDASKFAWVIPVTALPEFSVGSQTLFNNLLAGSVPTYGFGTVIEQCSASPDAPPPNAADDSGGSAGLTGGDPEDGDSGDDGPKLLYSATVGAFEIAVLQDDDVDSLMQWLGDNGFQQDEKARPIFAEYLKEGHLFVAFKLARNTDVAEIHPVVLKYTGDESCVPIRLTRIAAQEDMDIRAFFLGDTRTVPINYRHVLINPLKIDWPNLAANYKAVITLAVDAFAADGNAFVTEYAGPSNVVTPFGLYDPAWDPGAFTDTTPIEAVQTLVQQNLLYCYEDAATICQYNHPLLQGVLLKHIPVPDGLTPDEFYGCLDCYADKIDMLAWDAAAFTADYDQRLVQPGKHAVELLERYPYLTRMYTTISPDEMMEDPIFQPNADLGDVQNQLQATRLVRCDGHADWTLPDGRKVFVPDNGPWPAFVDELPWEEEVQTTSIKGAPMTLVNNTKAIDKALDAWNNKMDPVESDPEEDPAQGAAGCSCDAHPAPIGLAASLTLLGLFAIRPRRRS